MTPPAASRELKVCCANLYQSDLARALLGESFHPGGLHLTARLGEHLGLRPGMRVLDVASGRGDSAILLASQFGCQVVGVDFGPENVAAASASARAAGVESRVTFVEGDAERLQFPDADFDALICECAFCTFPNKAAAASEFARVLRPGAVLGLSDLTRSGPLPSELEGLLSWIACIADALSVARYTEYLTVAGFVITAVEPHNHVLTEMARDIQGKLLGLEVMVRLKKLDLPGTDFDQAKALARAAQTAIRKDTLGYTLLMAQK